MIDRRLAGEDEFFEPQDLGFVTQPAPAASIIPAGWSPTYSTTSTRGEELPETTTGTYQFGPGDEDLFRALGFQGPIYTEQRSGLGEDFQVSQDLTPEAQQFIQQGGYQLVGRPGQGGQYYSVVDPTGRLVTDPVFRREADDSAFRLATSLLGAAAGNVAGLSLSAAGVPGVLAKAIPAYIVSGGNEKAALGAGLGSLASPYIGRLGSAASEAVGGGTLGDIAGKAVTGAGTSALGAAARGGDIEDIGEALLAGGLGGATGALTSGLTKDLGLPEQVTRVGSSALTSALLGRDPKTAAVNALIGELMRAGQGGDRLAGSSELSRTSFLDPGEILATPLPVGMADKELVEMILGPRLAGESELGRTQFLKPEGIVRREPTVTGATDRDLVEAILGPRLAGESELSRFRALDPDKIVRQEPAQTKPEAQQEFRFPVQDFGTAPQSDINEVYNRIVNERGGFASTWQTVGSDRVQVQDDGSAIGINTETGASYELTPEETQRMVDVGLLNTDTSGYGEAIRGATPAPAPVAKPPTTKPPATKTPAVKPPGTLSKGADLAALFAAMAAMGGGRREAAEPYQLANVRPGVEAGLKAIEEMYKRG